MTDKYLTLKEAQEFTGKSRSTLRRFVEAIVKADDSPDRHYLRPAIDAVAELKLNNQPFSWRVSVQLLTREFPMETTRDESAGQNSGVSDGNRIITVLETTVAVLQKELTEKNKQISGFQDRQAEHNVLMKQLQQQLALNAPAGESPKPNDAGPTVVTAEEQPPKDKSVKPTEVNAKVNPESRIPFHWLFKKR